MSRLALRTSGRRWVGLLEAATSVVAVGGGIGLMVNGLGMPEADAPELLGGTWTLPGLALIGVIGIGQGVAAALELTDSPRVGSATLAAGAAMVAFEVAELALIPFSWLTPAFLGVGVVEIASSVSRTGGAGAARPRSASAGRGRATATPR
jgi:hypothetical protein